MGMYHYATVIYGVRETKALIKARDVKHTRQDNYCPEGHSTTGPFPSNWTMCPVCGAKPITKANEYTVAADRPLRI